MWKINALPLPARLGDDEIVPVAVAYYTEKALRDMLRAAGGRWDPQEKVWHVTSRFDPGTDLEGRILRR